jgi:hypothetical protein
MKLSKYFLIVITIKIVYKLYNKMLLHVLDFPPSHIFYVISMITVYMHFASLIP